MSSKLSMERSSSPRKNIMMSLALGVLTYGHLSFADQYSEKQIQSLISSPYVSWGIDAKKLSNVSGLSLLGSKSKIDPTINLLSALKIFKKSKDVVVGVVDTGINFDHEFIKENLVDKNGKKASKKSFGFDFSILDKKRRIKTTETPDDTHGHGTHVSAIVKSVFPEVKLLALKYYNPKASGQENLNATLKALRAAIDSNVDIINYSGGGPEESAEEKALLEEAYKKGILVVAAAGNESSNIDGAKSNAYYPASYNMPNIISVAAYNFNGKSLELIQSSNYGHLSVDIAAPGFRILSASNNDKDVMTGTSQATAFVTGVAAMIKSMYPNLKAEEIKNILVASAPEIETFKKKTVSSGKLDAYEALVKAGQVGKTLVAERGLSKDKDETKKVLRKAN
jgi:subtilisin family serine protease